jgi:hypothetical protein
MVRPMAVGAGCFWARATSRRKESTPEAAALASTFAARGGSSMPTSMTWEGPARTRACGLRARLCGFLHGSPAWTGQKNGAEDRTREGEQEKQGRRVCKETESAFADTRHSNHTTTCGPTGVAVAPATIEVAHVRVTCDACHTVTAEVCGRRDLPQHR